MLNVQVREKGTAEQMNKEYRMIKCLGNRLLIGVISYGEGRNIQ
jgi:hypothetical protein